MPVPTTMTSITELLTLRLFGGNHAQLAAWMHQASTRAALANQSVPIAPLQLPSYPDPIKDGTTLTQLCETVQQSGFALYEWNDVSDDVSKSIARLLLLLSLHGGDEGVMREVGELSLLQDLSGTPKGRFPPYQPKAMNWHTDGYYNDAAETIRCFTLHCVAPAAEGGALLLMDDAYLIFALWQENPELVVLLSHPEAMTLPGNKDKEGHDRPDRSVPVISRNADESLSMRFTTRTQHIQWRCEATQAAAQRASELITANPQWHTRIMLQENQGVITRNVLHAREQFTDAPEQPKRQMLRGRFTSLPKLATTIEPTHSFAEHNHVAP